MRATPLLKSATMAIFGMLTSIDKKKNIDKLFLCAQRLF